MKKIIYISAALLLLLTSCYSLNSASIDYTKLHTVSVENFPSYAALASPMLSQNFTEELKNTITSQSQLTLIKEDGDVQLSGKITGYSTAPVAIQQGETAAMTRLTITVHVKYDNTKDQSKNFEQDFSEYADYDNSKNFASVESSLEETISKKLAQDIFNKAFSNW